MLSLVSSMRMVFALGEVSFKDQQHPGGQDHEHGLGLVSNVFQLLVQGSLIDQLTAELLLKMGFKGGDWLAGIVWSIDKHHPTKQCVSMQVSFKKSDNAQAGEIEERVVSLVSNLFQGLARGSRRDRLAAKFVENEFEKCDRLMEIYTRYTRRVVIQEVSYFYYSFKCPMYPFPSLLSPSLPTGFIPQNFPCSLTFAPPTP